MQKKKKVTKFFSGIFLVDKEIAWEIPPFWGQNENAMFRNEESSYHVYYTLTKRKTG